MTGESDRAREKERLREERELQRLGAAQGVAIDTAFAFAPVESSSSTAGPTRGGFKRLHADSHTTDIDAPVPRPPTPPPAAAPAAGPASRPRAAAFFDDEGDGAAAAPPPPRAVIGTLAVGKRQRFAEMGKDRPPPGALMGDAAATRATPTQNVLDDDDGDDGDLLGSRAAASAPAASSSKIKIQLGSLKPR